jgi:hypothetical protein
MKTQSRPGVLYAACFVLALLAGAIIAQSTDLSWTSLVFIVLALGGGLLAFVAGVMVLLRKRAKNSP